MENRAFEFKSFKLKRWQKGRQMHLPATKGNQQQDGTVDQ
jgi:hypothetical protein